MNNRLSKHPDLLKVTLLSIHIERIKQTSYWESSDLLSVFQTQLFCQLVTQLHFMAVVAGG